VNKLLLCAVAVVMLAGCQPKESDTTQANVSAQRKEEARKLTMQGMMLIGQKDYQAGLASLDAAIKLDPTDQDPYLILGQLLLKAGEFNRASEFLENAAKNFPDNGMIFYMLSISNKMNGKKLPAVLAARRSFEIFKNANDQDNAQKAAILLEEVIKSPDTPVKASAKK
jgi:tetratricopeptide (TPR) repeat protein